MEVMKVTELAKGADEAVELLLSKAYTEALVRGIEAVSGIEELERVERDGVVTRVMRYSAPTASKIPSFLSRYASNAPSHVHWEQRERWDIKGRRMSYEIVAEVKAEWQRYYSASGSLALESVKQGSATRMAAQLRYEVNVFGFKRLAERALQEEIERMLALQGEIARDLCMRGR